MNPFSHSRLILASQSPRRAELLRNAGFAFEVRAAPVNETPLEGEPARDYVVRLAREKARAVARLLGGSAGEALVLGADTAVLAGAEILGKPRDEQDARRMLRLLSDKTHEVLTGVALIQLPHNREAAGTERTLVTFGALTESDIEEYVATGEPFDKAGAYGIQGIAGRFIPRIDGCYFNVMGLPLARVAAMLREFGFCGRSPAGARSS